MTFDEKIRLYEARTRRLEAKGKFIKCVLLGGAALITSLAGLVAILMR